MIMYNFLIAEC